MKPRVTNHMGNYKTLTMRYRGTMIKIEEGKDSQMQIKKTYKNINPDLLYHEIRDFAQKQGAVINEEKLETYSLPTDSSSFISRGTITFKIQHGSSQAEKECLTAHMVGSAKGETKLMLDIDEKLFPEQKVSALQEDLDFIFSSYEVKPG